MKDKVIYYIIATFTIILGLFILYCSKFCCVEISQLFSEITENIIDIKVLALIGLSILSFIIWIISGWVIYLGVLIIIYFKDI